MNRIVSYIKSNLAEICLAAFALSGVLVLQVPNIS